MKSVGSGTAPQTAPHERASSVRVLERTLQLIEVFARSRSPYSITDLAEAVALPVSTVHRLVQSLMALGYVTQHTQSKRYGVGRGLAELSRAMLLKHEYSQYAEPHLERLVAETGETANLASVYGTSAMYLNQVESPEMMKVSNPVGTLIPLHSSAVGKVFLADFSQPVLDDTLAFTGLKQYTTKTITSRSVLDEELQRIRQNNYAVDDEEFALGARCVAVGLRGTSGAVSSVISVSGPTMRVTDDVLPAVARLVLEAAERFSRQLREP